MKTMGFKETINWYDNNANFYAQAIQNLPSVGLDEFIEKVPKGYDILDIGCASGRDTKRIVDKGFKAVGLDLSKELIKFARKNYPNIRFVQGNFLKLPFPDNFFGGVWSHASLVHLESVKDVLKALKEFYRVLIIRGVIHVFVKEKTTDKKFDVVEDNLSYHERFFQYFTKDEIKELVQKSGFSTIKLARHDDPGGRVEVKWIRCLAEKK